MGKSYEDLALWQEAMELVTEVYILTQRFPRQEQFGLTSQMQRAAVSVPSNIAEGQGRATRGEFKQFLCHARGSLYELNTQARISINLKYASSEDVTAVIQRIDKVGKLLHGLLRSIG